MIRKSLQVKMLAVLLILLISSCSAYKKIPYLTEAEQIAQQDLKSVASIAELKIMPKDVLSITVNTPTSEVSADFNMPLVPTGMSAINQTQLNSGSTLQNYIVDKEGYIEFPVLGRIEVGGLTRSEIEHKIKSLVYPQYIKEKPIVNVRCLNLKISILGEVAKPGVYPIEGDRITLFDALATAGDLTIYGRRDNVMLIRSDETGELKIYRIDLQDKSILLNKDLFYLQQNDKLIVEANKTRGNNSSIGALESLGLSALSILISVIAIVTR